MTGSIGDQLRGIRLRSQPNMKVTVVGLLPAQARAVEADFPYVNFNFVSKERSQGSDITKACEGAERVYLMTKFIGHWQQTACPKEKTTLIYGGLTQLRAAISMAYATRGMAAEELKEETVNMPRDSFSQFMEPLATLKDRPPAGTVLSLPRPKELTKENWSKRVGANRSYYGIRYGVKSEQSVDDDGDVTITVMPYTTAAPPETSITEPAPPAELPVQPPVSGNTSLAQVLWKDAFLLSLSQNPGMPYSQHSTVANHAVNAFLTRFPNA